MDVERLESTRQVTPENNSSFSGSVNFLASFAISFFKCSAANRLATFLEELSNTTVSFMNRLYIV